MPRKKRNKRRLGGRSAIAPWVILAGSLSVIGFACTRTPQSTHVGTPPHHPVAIATNVAAVATPAPAVTPTPAPVPAASITAEPAATQRPTSPAEMPTSSPATQRLSSAPPATRPPADNAAPRLALIIDDCGQWLETERGFIALPVALTLSILPDVRFNHTIEREAADADKGVMLHLPMETLSGLNPGPGKITTEMDDAAIVKQVERDLGDVDLARGVNNHEGSKATASVRVMNDVMSVLAQRNRFFIDSRTNRASVAESVAQQRGVATASRDIFLDNRADVAYTEMQLRAAITIAKRDGSAIAIGHPRPSTLIAIRKLIPQIEAAGIKFVRVADLTH